MVHQFMVDCTLPNDIPEELIRLLPIQQEVLGKYMTEGKLIHYALSLENSKLWAIVNANSEIEVFEMIFEDYIQRVLERVFEFILKEYSKITRRNIRTSTRNVFEILLK